MVDENMDCCVVVAATEVLLGTAGECTVETGSNSDCCAEVAVVPNIEG